MAQLPEAQQNNLLNELFGQSGNSIGVNYLRVSIGASDLSNFVFSYNDLNDPNATDEALELAAGGAQGGAYTNPPMCGVVGWTMAGC